MKRIYLWFKKLLGFRMMYGELAEIAGDGPCRRCVGRALSGPVSSFGTEITSETITRSVIDSYNKPFNT